MVRIISQKTYDDVVRENIDEFGMTVEEAISDAIKQFEAQGVDLSNIIKDVALTGTDELHMISAAVDKLKSYTTDNSVNKQTVIDELKIVQCECDKDMSRRLLAGREGAYDAIIALMQTHTIEQHRDIIVQCLETMVSLMCGQPDLLTVPGVELMISYISKEKQQPDIDIQHLVLRWIRDCCEKHEHNRQHIFDSAILDHLKPLLHEDTKTPVPVLRAVCAVLRALVLDDDVRVEFGKAHEHARIIAVDTLGLITDLLIKHKDNEEIVHDLLLTLSALVVRNEFCKKVEDAGGVRFLLQALEQYNSNEKICKQGLKLLKVLAGNDECKVHIIQQGAAPIIVQTLTNHKCSAPTTVTGLNALAALTLRSPDNSRALFEAGLPDVIVECMQLHPAIMHVQRSASWAIRNMVSRSRYQNDKFLSLGVEGLLQEALAKFRNQCEYDLKASLRDLGCKVDLTEAWTGKGGRLTTQQTAMKYREREQYSDEEDATVKENN
ncbi:uncharacterized protein CBL_03963 [Carabus blaptoides fortunei]